MSSGFFASFKNKIAGYKPLPPTSEEILNAAQDSVDEEELDENDSDSATLLSHVANIGKSSESKAHGVGRTALTVVSQIAGGPGKVVTASNLAGLSSIAGEAAIVATVVTPAVAATAVISAVTNLVAFSKTYSHLARLKQISEWAAKDNAPHDLQETLAYVILKKNAKLKKKGLGSIGLGVVGTIYSAGKALKKTIQKTRGKNRQEYAETLWYYTKAGNKYARAASAELIGEERLRLIENTTDGYRELFDKMKSG
jgi:hypothetical protein